MTMADLREELVNFSISRSLAMRGLGVLEEKELQKGEKGVGAMKRGWGSLENDEPGPSEGGWSNPPKRAPKPDKALSSFCNPMLNVGRVWLGKVSKKKRKKENIKH